MWLIITAAFSVLPPILLIAYRRKEDGCFDIEEYWPEFVYFASALTIMILLKLLFSVEFSDMAFSGWKGWGLNSLWLSLIPVLSFFTYKMLCGEFDFLDIFAGDFLESDEFNLGLGIYVLVFIVLIALKLVWWLIV